MKPNSLQTQPTPTRQDHTLLRNTLLKLTAIQKIVCALVVVAVALVWYNLLNRLVAFGQGIDYEGLHALGVKAVSLLKQYNPFFWWAVVALCTLIIAYFLYGIVRSAARRTRATMVGEAPIQMQIGRASCRERV